MSESTGEAGELVAVRRDRSLWLTMNRPASLNALGPGMLAALADAIDDAGGDDDVRVIVLTGSGRAFSSGGDLSDSSRPADGARRGDPDLRAVDAVGRLVRTIRAVPVPVVAAVNGPAVGAGCSIALAADLAVARESAYFMLAFSAVGLMPDGGATAFVPAAIGRMRAARMAMLAERIPAPMAFDWGLISHVVPDDRFDAEVASCVSRLAAGPPLAYALTKRALDASSSLEVALALEREGQAACLMSADFAEGVRAFRSRTRPRFNGT